MKTISYLWALTRVSGNGKGDPAPLMRCCHPRHEMAPPKSALSYTTGWGFLYGRVPKRRGKALQGMARLHRHWNGFTGTGTALQAPQQIRNKPKHSKTAQQREEESQLSGLFKGKPGSEHAIRQPQPRKVAFQTSRGVNNCQDSSPK